MRPHQKDKAVQDAIAKRVASQQKPLSITPGDAKDINAPSVDEQARPDEKKDDEITYVLSRITS